MMIMQIGHHDFSRTHMESPVINKAMVFFKKKHHLQTAYISSSGNVPSKNIARLWWVAFHAKSSISDKHLAIQQSP